MPSHAELPDGTGGSCVTHVHTWREQLGCRCKITETPVGGPRRPHARRPPPTPLPVLLGPEPTPARVSAPHLRPQPTQIPPQSRHPTRLMVRPGPRPSNLALLDHTVHRLNPEPPLMLHRPVRADRGLHPPPHPARVLGPSPSAAPPKSSAPSPPAAPPKLSAPRASQRRVN